MKRVLLLSLITLTISSVALGKTVTTGKGFGFKNYVTVEVIKNGETIENISVIEHGDTEKYADPAFNLLIADIIDTQSIDVDGLAGATGSSMGLKLAVEDALSK